jgi:hypothetical protein
MKICDVCQKTTCTLRVSPLDPKLELCEECERDWFRRVSAMEAQLDKMRHQMRAQVLAEWWAERGPKP